MQVREVFCHIGAAQVFAFLSRCLVCFLEAGSLKSYGVLVEDLTKQANMSFTVTGLILPLQHSVAYFVAPLAQALHQRLGPRITVMCGGLLVAFGYLGNGLLPLHPTLLLIFCCCAGAGYGVAFTPTYVFLKEAFPDKTVFGVVQGLADQFQYVGISILPLIFDRFQNSYGTQDSLVLFGAINLNILVAGVILQPISSTKEQLDYGSATKPPTHEKGGDEGAHSTKSRNETFNAEIHTLNNVQNRQQMIKNDGISSEEKENRNSNHSNQSNTYYSVLSRNPSLIFLLLVVASTSVSYFGWVLFLIPLGKEKGLSSEDAVLLSTCAGVGALIGRIWSITLFIRQVESPFHYFGLPCLLQSALFFVLAKGPSDFWILAGISFVTGISFGHIGSSVGGVCSLKVKPSDFQIAVVLMFMVIACGTEVGGGITGAVRDATGSSKAVFLVLAGSNFYIVLISIIWSVYEYYQTRWKNLRESL